jgi:radical SAM protein with 4Fe4S-binding SPASM domain
MLSAIPEHEVLGISPFVRLRRERAKVTVSFLPHMTLRFGALSPEQAAMFALIDGSRTFAEVIDAVALITELPRDAAKRYLLGVLRYITPEGEMLVRDAAGKRCRRYDPEQFLIPASQVDLEARLEAPLSVLFQITYACQADCIYCYSQRRPIPRNRHLPTARVLSLLDEMAEIGVGQVNLCGGDPLCHPDIVAIVDHGLGLGLTLDLSTKAHVGRQLADDLAATGLDYIQVSIEADDDGLGDRIYGRKGQYRRVVESLRNLLATPIFTRTNSIITKLNVDRIEPIIAMLAALGVREMKFSPAFRSMYVDTTGLLLDEAEIARFETAMAELADRWAKSGVVVLHSVMPDPTRMTREQRQDYWFNTRPGCSSGRSSLIINPDGDVSLCEEAPQEGGFIVGNVGDRTLRQIWNCAPLRRLAFPDRSRFAGAPCQTCGQFDRCVLSKGHCFKDAYKGYGRPFTVNPFCPEAPAPLPRLY